MLARSDTPRIDFSLQIIHDFSPLKMKRFLSFLFQKDFIRFEHDAELDLN